MPPESQLTPSRVCGAGRTLDEVLACATPAESSAAKRIVAVLFMMCSVRLEGRTGKQGGAGWGGVPAPPALRRWSSAELHRYEDLRVLALHQQRDVFAGLGDQRAQLGDRFHRRAVHREDDVALLDAGLRSRSADVLDEQAAVDLRLLALVLGERTHREPETAVLAAARCARDLIALQLADHDLDILLAAVAPHLEPRLAARLDVRHHRRQLVRVVNRLAVDREDHVAGF